MSKYKIVAITIFVFLTILLFVGYKKDQMEPVNNTKNVEETSNDIEDYSEATDYTYNYTDYSDYTYTFSKYSFNFKYTNNWIVEETSTWEASPGVEACPDWGVDLYIEGDKENKIAIFGCHSPRNPINFSKVKEFIVDDIKIGDLYIGEYNGKINILALYNKSTSMGFQNAVVFVTDDFYQQHKDEIWHILASVKY